MNNKNKSDWYWIQNTIPKNECICVQYKNNNNSVIAISTRDLTNQFKMYQITKDKKLSLLGKGKDIGKLEDKFIGSSEAKGFIIKSQKQKGEKNEK